MDNYIEDRRAEDKSLSSNLAVIAESISHLKEDVAELKQDFKKLNQTYVTKIEFAPVKTIAFGLVGALLLGIITAILKLAVK